MGISATATALLQLIRLALRRRSLDKEYHQSILAGSPAWRVVRYNLTVEPENFPLACPINQYISPTLLNLQLAQLAREFSVIPLQELVTAILQDKPIAPKTVALVFENPYQAFYDYALPLLVKHKLPATLFVNPGSIGTNEMFWYEKIQLGLLAIHISKGSVREIVFLQEHFPDLLEHDCREAADFIKLANSVITRLHLADAEMRVHAVASIWHIANQHGGLPDITLLMDWEQLKETARLGLSIGIQGLYPKRLIEIERDELGHDMVQAVKLLRDNGIAPIPTIYPPEGLYDQRSLGMLHSLGAKAIVAPNPYPEPHPVRVLSTRFASQMNSAIPGAFRELVLSP